MSTTLVVLSVSMFMTTHTNSTEPNSCQHDQNSLSNPVDHCRGKVLPEAFATGDTTVLLFKTVSKQWYPTRNTPNLCPGTRELRLATQ